MNYSPITIALGLILMFILGFEAGKKIMMARVKETVKEVTEELVKATQKLKEQQQ